MELAPWHYIVILGLFVIVFAFVRTKSEPKQDHTLNMKEIEETIEHFMGELAAENKELLQLVADSKKDNEHKNSSLLRKIDDLERKQAELQRALDEQSRFYKQGIEHERNEREQWQSRMNAAATAVAASSEVRTEALTEEVVEPPMAMNIKARYQELFALYEQGKAIDYIAKKIGMNRGEVQLIIELGRQEEQLRA